MVTIEQLALWQTDGDVAAMRQHMVQVRCKFTKEVEALAGELDVTSADSEAMNAAWEAFQSTPEKQIKKVWVYWTWPIPEGSATAYIRM